MAGYSQATMNMMRRDLSKKWNVDPDQITDKHIDDHIKGQADSGKNTAQALAGVGALGGGAVVARDAINSGNVDGLARMFHNTEKGNVKSILEKGLTTDFALDPNNVTSHAGIPKDQMANKVYIAKKKSIADGVGLRRQQVADHKAAGGFLPPPPNPIKAKMNQKTMKVNIPLEDLQKMKQVANPELRGAKSAKEFKEILQKENPFQVIPDMQAKQLFNGLGRDTVVLENNVDEKYFKGSSQYAKRGIKDVARHVKNNPKAFAKGVGALGAGVGLGALGIAAINDARKKLPKNPFKEKTASYYCDIIEKNSL